MPPKPILNKEELLNAAIDIIRESGIGNLNARSLASKLNCSTKPLFRIYSNMDDLKSDVYKRAEQVYEKYLSNMQDNDISPFLQMGLNYIRFSCYEKNLFKFIFLSNNLEINSFYSIADMAETPEIIDFIMTNSGLPIEKAKDLFASLWSMTHGISCTIATNQYNLNETEILRLLETAYKGILSELRKDNLQNEN